MFGILTRYLRDYLQCRGATVDSIKAQHINGEQSRERGGAHVMMHNNDADWNKPEGSEMPGMCKLILSRLGNSSNSYMLVVRVRVVAFTLSPHHTRVITLLKEAPPAAGRCHRPARDMPSRDSRHEHAGHRVPKLELEREH